jgi:hypothetical protein
MSIRYPNDALLPQRGADTARAARLKPAVFVPIALALIGVAAILFGGLTVRGPAPAVSKAEQIDPVVTGSIQPASFDEMSPAEQRQVLEMLDR